MINNCVQYRIFPLSLSTLLVFSLGIISVTFHCPIACHGFQASFLLSSFRELNFNSQKRGNFSSTALSIFGRKFHRSTTHVTPILQWWKRDEPIVYDNIDGLPTGNMKLPGGVHRPKIIFSSTLISEPEILAVQNAWAESLLRIALCYEDKGYKEAKKIALNLMLYSLYGYSSGMPVLFKPTLASGEQTYRLTEEGALSYLVGGNRRKFPMDTGFALQGWRKVKSYPVGILLHGNTALSMGTIFCIDKYGKCVAFDNTWGYKKDCEGNVRVILHHSSLPYPSHG